VSTRRALVVGLGKRVREAAMPALLRSGIEVVSAAARTPRREEIAGRAFDVRALPGLTTEDLAAVDLVYLAVGKGEVPAVLARLAGLGVGHAELLIDTPVVRFKHLHHARKLRAFRAASVPEDCAHLPWFDAVAASAEGGPLGAPTAVRFDRSAYAYHGLASGKALLSAGRVVRGVRRSEGNRSVREVDLVRGDAAPAGALLDLTPGTRRRLEVVEPRDYASGHVVVTGERGVATDAPGEHPGAFPIKAELEAAAGQHVVAAVTCGDHRIDLDDDERALTLGAEPGASVIALQEAMKRVGLLRILRRVAAGEGGYPLLEGLDDMVVDYHLERLGRYRANPVTSARGPLLRVLAGL